MQAKQRRAIVIVGLVFAGLAVWVLTTQRGRVPDKEELLGLQESRVSALRITFGKSDGPTERTPGEVVTVEKRGDEWLITQPLEGLADPTVVEAMVKELAQVKVGRRPNVDPTDPKFGLDKPVLTVEGWWDGGAKSLKVTIGGEAPVGNKRYATIEGRQGLFLVPSVFRTTMDKPVGDLRDRRLWREPPESVTEATVSRGDTTVTVQRTSAPVPAAGPGTPAAAAKWALTAPVSARADTSAVDRLVRTLLTSDAVDFAQWPERPADYGFERPQATIELRTASGKAARFVVGKKSTREVTRRYGGGTERREVVFMMREGRQEALLMEASVLGALLQDQMGLRDKRILTLDRKTITGLRVESKTAYSFSATKQGEQWRLTSAGNAPLPASSIEAIISSVLQLQATEYVQAETPARTDHGLDLPQTVVTLTSGGKQTRILFGAHPEGTSGQVYARTSESRQVYVVPASTLQALPKTLDELKSGGGPLGGFGEPGEFTLPPMDAP